VISRKGAKGGGAKGGFSQRREGAKGNFSQRREGAKGGGAKGGGAKGNFSQRREGAKGGGAKGGGSKGGGIGLINGYLQPVYDSFKTIFDKPFIIINQKSEFDIG
jgi:hypothetical protein